MELAAEDELALLEIDVDGMINAGAAQLEER